MPEGGLVPGVAGWLCCAGARGGLACFVACRPCLELTFLPPSPRPRSQSALPGGKGENHSFLMQGASPLASPGLGGKRHWRWEGGSDTPAGACSSSVERSIWILHPRQKRLSRFCNTRHPSRHAGVQEKAGTGRERWFSTIIIRSGKFWGVRGTLSRVPRRISVSPRISAVSPARALQKRRNRPRGAVPGDDYSAVRPERSMPCTRKFWQKAYRMTSGRMIHRPQVFRIAA